MQQRKLEKAKEGETGDNHQTTLSGTNIALTRPGESFRASRLGADGERPITTNMFSVDERDHSCYSEGSSMGASPFRGMAGTSTGTKYAPNC